MPFDNIKPVPADATARDIVTGMIELIEKRGWCQHSLQDASGRLCILGAAKTVIFADAPVGMALTNAHRFEALNLRPFFPDGKPAQWNDTPGRTRDEVLAKLREIREAYDAV